MSAGFQAVLMHGGAALMCLVPLTRALDEFLPETAAQEYAAGNIADFLHLYPGEKAVASGVLSCAEPGDYIVSTYREHVHALLGGIPAAAMMNVPGLRIVVPVTPQDAYWQLRQAIRSDDPGIVLEHEMLYFRKAELETAGTVLPMHAVLVWRDLSCIAYSRMVEVALAAADELAKEGIEMEVIDLRSLSPIDWETCVQSVAKTHHALVLEEDCCFVGAGAEIVASLQEHCFYFFDRPIQRLAGLDLPTPFNAALEAASIPDVQQVKEASRDLLHAQGESA